MERIKKATTEFSFELVYWAHYLYVHPLKPRIKDPEDPLYVEDPYSRAKEVAFVEQPSELRLKILDYLNEQQGMMG